MPLVADRPFSLRYSATDATPITDMFAVRGIRSMLTALETLQKTGQDDSETMLDARADALEASWLCGTTLGAVHMGLHHKLCHTMGGMLNTPHAETHAILLPFTLLYNYGSLTSAQKGCFGQAFDTQDGLTIAQRLRSALTNQAGVPLTLKDIGVAEEDLPKVAAQAASAPYPNPRPLVEDKLLLMLRCAWQGTLENAIQE
ncbi:alcohol dehydrogenase [Pseudozyma hubeiensis SY62]|uniref:Alcohol dehydrogenase n=1 Tax=Pseudozyma hubeiensis (strain SY62) TaxID=1305764 RepID=R9PAX3_PSEHS|nr:alcohol dehydrogenase [Pseudozyma hubeiensis SY62]GAC98499.1 alcohol dehydrogenase [Pseudozyma hubeiensis SY62]